MAKIIGLVQVKSRAGWSTVSTNLSGELSKVCKTVLIGRVMPQPALGKIDRSQSSVDVNLKNLFFINIQAMISNKPFKLKYSNVVPQSGLHPLLNEI